VQKFDFGRCIDFSNRSTAIQNTSSEILQMKIELVRTALHRLTIWGKRIDSGLQNVAHIAIFYIFQVSYAPLTINTDLLRGIAGEVHSTLFNPAS